MAAQQTRIQSTAQIMNGFDDAYDFDADDAIMESMQEHAELEYLRLDMTHKRTPHLYDEYR